MTTPNSSLFDEMVQRGILSAHDIERRAQIARAEAIASGIHAIGRALRRLGQRMIARLGHTDAAGRITAATPATPANTGQRGRDAA